MRYEDKKRKNACKRVVDRFIRNGADYEINISAIQRERVIAKIEKGNTDKLINIFDEVYKEIDNMMQLGPWKDFLRRRHTPDKATIPSMPKSSQVVASTL